MRRKSLDLAAICAITLLGTLLIVADVPSPLLRLPLTVPVVLFCPGYALLAAINPRSGLGIVERGLLALGLSLVLVALGGAVLHQLPWGLQAGTWTLFLCPVIFGGSFVAWRRRRACNPPDVMWSLSMNISQRIYVGLSVLVVAGAIALAVAGTPPAHDTVPTQLWLFPTESASMQYIRVGLRNMESRAITYRISLEIDGRPVYQGDLITLEPQEIITPTIDLPEAQAPLERIEIKLYHMDHQETVYRRLTHWRAR